MHMPSVLPAPAQPPARHGSTHPGKAHNHPIRSRLACASGKCAAAEDTRLCCKQYEGVLRSCTFCWLAVVQILWKLSYPSAINGLCLIISSVFQPLRNMVFPLSGDKAPVCCSAVLRGPSIWAATSHEPFPHIYCNATWLSKSLISIPSYSRMPCLRCVLAAAFHDHLKVRR